MRRWVCGLRALVVAMLAIAGAGEKAHHAPQR
jgi:hypothetical protein